MRIKLKYSDVETFVQRYSGNISRGGIFIGTKSPKPVGTLVRFEFLLSSQDPPLSIIRGEGQVQWTKEPDPANPGKAPGMGVKFTRLDPESRVIVDRALAYRSEQAPARKEPPPLPTIPPADTQPESLHAAAPGAPPPLLGEDTDPAIPLLTAPPDEVAQETRERHAANGTPNGQTDGALGGRSADQITKPVTLPPVSPEPPTAPVPVHRSGATHLDPDALAAELGLSEDRLARTLKRSRPKLVEATAELEELLLKPARGPTPTRREALERLAALLDRRSR